MRTLAPPRRSPARGRRVSPLWPAALAVDVALVLLFAALGRNAHALEATGLLETAWPFLAGLLAGWAAWRVDRAPAALWPRGVGLWLTTVAVGMLLRAVTGEGTATSFVLVSLGVLGSFLLGHRAVARVVGRLLPGRRPHRGAA